MTRKSVLDSIRKEIEVHSIRIKGNNKDKSDAFYILMNTQQLISDEKEVFHGIKNSTITLLENAEIPFEIISGGETTHKTSKQNNTHNLTNPVLDTVSRIDGCEDPQDDSGEASGAAKEDTGHGTFPAGLNSISRIEVIELGKRQFVKWNCKVEESIQDKGRTLKLFVSDS